MSPDGLQRLLPGASRELCRLLDAAAGAVEPAVRSEIFGPERFAQHGRSLGLTHAATRSRLPGVSFFPRLRSNIRMLRQAHRYITTQAATGYDISPAAEWLLDNFHLIEMQLATIHEGLPLSYFRRLPVLQGEPLAGLPRVYGVAWAFVAHTDSAFDEDLLVHYLVAYQHSRELQLGEMWALPTTLRVVLVENLRRLAERVATHKAAREVANLCCDRIMDWSGPALERVHARMALRGVGPAFVVQVLQRLQDRGVGGGIKAEAHLPASVQAWLQALLPELPALQLQQGADQTADNLSVSNAVTSLRAIGDIDWPDIIARCSLLMQLMLTSPLFAAEHTTTRDQTLHDIERLSRRSQRSELAVAQALLDLMQAAGAGVAAAEPVSGPASVTATEPARALAAHWLQGAGRPALTQALGMRVGLAPLARRVWQAAALPLYLACVSGGTLALVAWMLHRQGAGLTAWVGALTALLMLLPASEAVVAVVHRLISESARPHLMPRLALTAGIPPEHGVMVVIPALLTDAAATGRLAHRLHLHALANPEAHAQFALLTDWADAAAADAPADEALLAHAVQQIERLNASARAAPGAAPGAAPRFVLLHRRRQYCATEQCWVGWERKRGKLGQLIAALAGAPDHPFVDLGEVSRIAPGAAYVLTLDSDTQLPPGRLRELVSVAAHPHNTPRLSADGRRVRSGYGILQPHLVTPLPAPQDLTPYHWLFAGQPGIDPYSAASSEVYQDVFGEGSFTGKGLLHVQAVHAVLGGRLPDGRVLSHDLLEGSLARCAAVTDIPLIEDAPFHADVAASRLHRWTRGDWQLLPFLLQDRRYPLRAVNRWKMLDNLRRSLVAPAALALLVLVLAAGTLSPPSAVLLVLAAFAAGPLMGALAGLAPGRDDVAKRHFYRAAALDLARALCGGLWHLALLLERALLVADAITRTLYRMVFSQRHLLQWTTAAAAQAAAQTTLAGAWRQHRAVPAVALALLAALLAGETAAPAWAAALCALWAAAPLWTWWASRPRAGAAAATLSAEDQATLHGVARDTWRYFERCVTAADRHLPPDNLQTTPHEMLARRTSPTNIGLYLLSTACARQFGWIGTLELALRLEATLASLATLQRHRGHFFNWYDTASGAPLLPMYVSTVDSGNLSGFLLAVAEACRELAATPGEEDSATRLQAVAQQCEQLAWEADFAFLYHPKRHLLHIGYRVAEQQLDAGFYDLLASESRLTSLLAIAKGDVPVRHWAALGRPFYAAGATAGLRSWAGSMFEYLMPALVLAEPHGSVLHDATVAALREQIAFARRHGVPWGISESAHSGRDHTLAYQYAPQGVPRLALRRTPPDELVIAPYATALAAQVDAGAACRNFTALQALAARGRNGFIEALDFTPARQTGGQRFTTVDTFMAHHQGMSIVALANVLLGGVAQRWGMASAHIEAMVSLLHERAPREVLLLPALPAAAPLLPERRAPTLQREVLPGAQAVEPTQLLSNGRYHVALRANGAGSSRRGTVGITRWRDDALRDEHGSFFYLRRAPGEPLVSLTQHPAPDPAAHYQSAFHADRVCLDATWPELQSRITVWVSPEDDIEFRQVELRNPGSRTLDVELISAFEVTLAEARADEAHPAFSNLFVRAEWRPAAQALVFERTPRLAGESGLHAAHFITESDAHAVALRGQTDRARWLGRNRVPAQPQATLQALPATPAALSLDTGLDPVCVLAVRLRIPPGGKAQLTFATAACDDGATLRAVIDKCRQPSQVQRASLMSATLAGIRLRALRIGSDDLAAIQLLTSALMLGLTRVQTAAADEACDRRLLWRLGLSGERPLLLVSAGALHGLGLLRSLSRALRLWAGGGVPCDLVVVNAEPASYQMALQREIGALRDRHDADSATQPAAERVGMHLLSAAELSAGELAALRSVARVSLQADGRPLLHHVQAWAALHDEALQARQGVATMALALASTRSTAALAAVGGFAAEGGDFSFGVHAAARPARPWINVLANPDFGTLVSEAGGGCTWALNSRLNQLTAWSNDPVADTPAEALLLQDMRSMEVWNVAPGARGDERVTYEVTHGQGYTTISHQRGDVQVQATWCVDPVSAVKQQHLRIRNTGQRTQRLRVTGIAEWLLGAARADRHTVHTARHRQLLGDAAARELLVLTATQREQAAGFGHGTAFLALAAGVGALHDWSCDRRECFDARGHPVLPDHWLQTQGNGLDPCAALSTRLALAAGASAECTFLLGYAGSPLAAQQLAAAAAAVAPAARLRAARGGWDELLGATTVDTPDPLFDALVNRWLLYQAVSCRLWAKAAFYQAGGATGYRDQLQDTLALAWAAPALLRAQIVRCASRQFAEGDVQHWWHEPGGAGVRTHFSDDLLWLPHACLHYLQASADSALLDEAVPFIEGQAIPEHAEDVYDTPRISADLATVYEHAARSIDRSLRVGAHGLPLMGSGDWNDGMNRVGAQGRGESVWLGWFLCHLVAGFAPLARARGEPARARRWEDAATGWRAALLGTAWDGQWFTRAYFDDGTPLGSHANAEARIDLIAQAWAVLSGVAPMDLQRRAMASVQTHLADARSGLVRLLQPPLAHARPSAGYIQAYPGGVRENGGQYTHAGVWAVMAQARLATAPGGTALETDEAADVAWRWFTWLSPAHRAAGAAQGAVYGLEPYAVAGDVYSQPPWAGRGGWSWYTGAAAWLHRAAVESIFGLRLHAGELSFRPCLPTHWPRAELTLRRDGRTMRFVLLRAPADQALAASGLAAAGAQLLAVGQALHWPALAGDSVFVIALPAAAPVAARVP